MTDRADPRLACGSNAKFGLILSSHRAQRSWGFGRRGGNRSPARLCRINQHARECACGVNTAKRPQARVRGILSEPDDSRGFFRRMHRPLGFLGIKATGFPRIRDTQRAGSTADPHSLPYKATIRDLAILPSRHYGVVSPDCRRALLRDQ